MATNPKPSMDELRGIMCDAVRQNNLDGKRMSELAASDDGPLQLAKMCEGYEEMEGMERIKMIVTSSVLLAAFKKRQDEAADPVIADEQEHAHEPPATGSKRAAPDEPEPSSSKRHAPDEPESKPESEPEPEPEPEPELEPLPQPALVRSYSIDPRNGSGL